MLIERKSTLHTGSAVTGKTRNAGQAAETGLTRSRLNPSPAMPLGRSRFAKPMSKIPKWFSTLLDDDHHF